MVLCEESKGSYSLDLGMEIGLAVAFKPKLILELGCQPHVLIGMAHCRAQYDS